ncbi:hypothetical protein [Streptomyces tunisiensis]|uniref:hypothetical protein n=1 Tax=Streptomyces tunisiensis TaxID=948699 RepID=UPI003EE3E891
MGGEAGKFPGSYAHVELGSLLRNIETGKSPAAEDTPAGDGEWGVLKVSSIQHGRFVPEENKVVRDSSLIVPSYEVRVGDLLMTRANTEDLVGLACIVQDSPPRLMLSDKTLRLVVDESAADPAFISLVLAQSSTRRQIWGAATGTSGSMKNISQAQIRQLHVPDVPLDEQRRIVAAHAVIEQRVSAQERVRAKLKTLRDSLTADLVVGPMEAVGEILASKPRNGFSPVEVSEWTGLLTLGLGCLTPDGFQPRQLKRISASNVASRFQLADGDLLMSRANTRDLVGLVGRYQDVGHPCIYPDLMMRLRPDSSRCIPHYLEIVLRSSSVRKAIQAGARGTSESMVKISAELVEALRIPVPSLEKQQQVVESVSALDRRILDCRAVINKLRSVQQGMVEEMLAGRMLVS